jgi:hypothetical protein
VEGGAAVVALGEDAVEDDDVDVEVGIEGGAEAVQEGDSAELGVTRSGRVAATRCCSRWPEAKRATTREDFLPHPCPPGLADRS